MSARLSSFALIFIYSLILTNLFKASLKRV
jgi:hypothetical protein